MRTCYLGKNIGGTEETPNFPLDNLIRHGLILGSTGSGKTGVGISIIESCLINNVPVIAIDPKGDIGNLLYMPTEFSTREFAAFEGVDGHGSLGTIAFQKMEERAKETLVEWGKWGIPKHMGINIQASTDIRLYTPGACYGLPLGLFGQATPGKVLANKLDRLNEASALASSLLTILGIKSTPTGDDKVLLERAIWDIWEEGKQADPQTIAQYLNSEEIYKSDTNRLWKRLNSLQDSIAFLKWRQKPTLDIDKLIHTGKSVPACSILNTVHLQPEEQQFFLGIFLSKLITWMKQQPSSKKLRLLLYIDEASGMIPSVSNPVTKGLLMTLVKTARAFGIGVVFATQNPGDIDYKALTNVGTWITGLLKTDRDRKKVADAINLEDRGIISELQKREFLYHDSFSGKENIKFQSRQTISYLKGPMDQQEIERVTHWRQPKTIIAETDSLDMNWDSGEFYDSTLTHIYQKNHFCPSEEKLVRMRMIQNLAWQVHDYHTRSVPGVSV